MKRRRRSQCFSSPSPPMKTSVPKKRSEGVPSNQSDENMEVQPVLGQSKLPFVRLNQSGERFLLEGKVTRVTRYTKKNEDSLGLKVKIFRGLITINTQLLHLHFGLEALPVHSRAPVKSGYSVHGKTRTAASPVINNRFLFTEVLSCLSWVRFPVPPPFLFMHIFSRLRAPLLFELCKV